MRPEPEMGARRLISGTGSKRLTGKRGVEDVGKRTRSDPIESVLARGDRTPRRSVRERQRKYLLCSHEAKQPRYNEIYVVLKAGPEQSMKSIIDGNQ